ncbi:unnamed protein product [Cylicostephanus goldi]|uniref:Ig-like domain-containing protein n=1 Tax=Cylicostephanus goldi TaxID=71465 RepID=A0A3P6S3V4_CYLGO|nr:unnamed protein product [Cylicostephanus goldi]
MSPRMRSNCGSMIRIGFKVNSKNAEEKISDQLQFVCIYKGEPSDTATYFIIISEAQKNDLELIFEEPDPWPYVGGQYSLICILKPKTRGRMEDKYQHYLNLTCPRCTHSEVRHTKSIRNDMLSHTVTIDTLTPEDSGQYACSWYFEQQLNKTIEHTVVVSPKMEQIKVLNRTLQEVNVMEGNSITLSADLAAFPHELSGFNAKWIRKYIKPPKTVNETENLVNDNDRQISSERLSGGRVTEKISIRNAATDMSGIYVLTIEYKDTVRTIEWRVSDYFFVSA